MAVGSLAAFVVGLSYFAFFSRHRLVANAPEEEAALVREAESELADSQDVGGVR